MTEGVVLTYVIVSKESGVYDMFRDMTEAMVKEAFRRNYGFESTDIEWLYEEARTLEDPQTGETYDLPAQWMCVAEGRQP